MVTVSPAPPGIVAVARATARRVGLAVVSLSGSPSFELVVRLDRPVAQLRRGELLAVVRVAARLGRRGWDVRAIDRSGKVLRDDGISAAGGHQMIDPALDGCDPSYVVIGGFTLPFGDDPICAGDPPAPAAHPVGVGGATVGRPFALTLLRRGRRWLAQINGYTMRSAPALPSSSPTGTATLRADGELSVALGEMDVLLTRE